MKNLIVIFKSLRRLNITAFGVRFLYLE